MKRAGNRWMPSEYWARMASEAQIFIREKSRGQPAEPDWYIVVPFPGHHRAVEDRIERKNFEVFRATLKREIRHARKITSKIENLFEGYVIVRFNIEDPSWFNIGRLQGVHSFLCARGDESQRPRPLALPPWAIPGLRVVFGQKGYLEQKWAPPDLFGKQVRVLDGPFEGFNGFCEEIVDGRGKFLLNLFGRQTPVELELHQVQSL